MLHRNLLRPLILWTGLSDIIGQVRQFLWLQGCVPDQNCWWLMPSAWPWQVCSLGLDWSNSFGGGVRASVVLRLAKMWEEVSPGSKFSVILRRFESLPYVVMTLTDFCGVGGGTISLLLGDRTDRRKRTNFLNVHLPTVMWYDRTEYRIAKKADWRSKPNYIWHLALYNSTASVRQSFGIFFNRCHLCLNLLYFTKKNN